MKPLYINADQDLFLVGARLADGTFLNSATVTWAVYTAAGSAVSGATGTLSYVSGSDGNYAGVIASTVNASFTENAKYTLIITLVQGGYNDERRIPCIGTYRRDQ